MTETDEAITPARQGSRGPQSDSIAAYRAANHYINEGLIRRDEENRPSELTRREWMLRFLPLLGDPQRSFAAIHVTGTSGKGSVCTMVAEILTAAGVRTGLHLSPYVQVATEKLWVDRTLASATEYAELVEWIRPFAEALRGPEVPMHGMASVGLFLEHFRRSRVELGVVEVGVGGRSDLTNVLETRVAALTNVGLDHVKTLGPTLEDIAHHKAGIIKRGCRAVVHAVRDDDVAVVAARKQARLVDAPLRLVRPGQCYRGRGSDGRTLVDYQSEHFDLRDIELALTGPFQASNAAVAIAICEESGAPIDEDAIRTGLLRARLAARVERIPSHRAPCQVLIDGAHNSDKLAGLHRALEHFEIAELHLLCGVLEQKTVGDGLSSLAARASTVTATEPRVYGKAARDCHELASELRGATPARVQAIADPIAALRSALSMANERDLIVVTGSIYLAGNVRDHFYPWENVLLQRDSWAEPPDAGKI
jgi:dihydrofolate synthase/folylpolyglutamate synthase